MMSTLRAALAERVVVADGAMGTMLQASDATIDELSGYEGCNEILQRMSDAGATAAVLFDMDGLLVDSEPLWLEAETAVMARLGADWTKADQRQLLGGRPDRPGRFPLPNAGGAAR